MVVGLGRRELAGSLLAVASLPSSLTPTPPFGLLPPTVTFGVQIYDDATAERLTLQAHANHRTCRMHTPCKCLARTVHVPWLLSRVQALSAGFRSFFTSPEGGNQLGFARAVRHAGLEPQTSRSQAGLLLTRLSLASDRSPAAAYRGSSCTSPAPCSRTCRWVSAPRGSRRRARSPRAAPRWPPAASSRSTCCCSSGRVS